MKTFRIMSYHINGVKDADGRPVPELIATVIRAQQPDLVLLQQLGSAIGETSLNQLAEATGLDPFGPDAEGGCAFLSRYAVKNIFNAPLGYGCRCVRADFEREEERVHLFNLTLSWDPRQRNEQLRTLVGEQLLGNPSLPCATIIAGDFGLPLWGGGTSFPGSEVKRARLPLWSATFPAKLPLWGRDRIYFRGPIRALSGQVVMSADARKASTHLPLVLTVESIDTREVLKLKKRTRVTAKHPNPVCG